MEMNKKILLWDFDGTLAYTGADVWVSLQYAAEKLGGKIPESFMKKDSNLGKSVKEIFHVIEPYPGDECYEKYDELVTVHYRKMNEYQNTSLYEGIRLLLLRMKMQGFVNYIVTMKPQEALERILKKKEWEVLFDKWYSPDSFQGREKTKKEMIEYVLYCDRGQQKQDGDIDNNYIYIGDTWSDVRAAHENQIPCIAVTYGDGETNRLLLERPEYVAENVTQLGNILREGKWEYASKF